MKSVIKIAQFIRNAYLAIAIIPLWLISVYYRVAPQLSGATRASLDIPWVLCILIFLLGVCACWRYIDNYDEARHKGAKKKGIVIKLVVLFLLLLASLIGAILLANKVAWGEMLFWPTTVFLPFVVLLMFSTEDHGSKKEEAKS